MVFARSGDAATQGQLLCGLARRLPAAPAADRLFWLAGLDLTGRVLSLCQAAVGAAIPALFLWGGGWLYLKIRHIVIGTEHKAFCYLKATSVLQSKFDPSFLAGSKLDCFVRSRNRIVSIIDNSIDRTIVGRKPKW